MGEPPPADEPPTVTLVQNPPTDVSSSAPRTGAAASTSSSLDDMLRRDEAGRVAVFARLTLLLCVFGLALTPLYGGDPIALRILVGALVAAMGTSLFVEWMTRKPARYSERRLILVVQLQELCATSAAYFFGVFSPFPAVVSLGIYVYSLGARFTNALVCYLNLAIGQAVLAGLIISGTIADRGIIRADDLAIENQLLVQSNVQFVYFVAFALARLSRRKTVAAVADLEAAIRAVAQREALFEEARQELQRAAWLGGPGRFTDQRIGPYRLEDVIGRGAMGEIYRATNVDTDTPAALKLLQRGILGDRLHLARFAREARIAASIDSPHVARILEVGEEPLPFLAMELLVGEDLAKVLRERRTLPLDETGVMLREVADGLAAAHDVGIIHRDVKPQNIFRATTSEGTTWKVLDFGVSKLVEDDGTLTRDAVVGTPAYMSPEQASGQPIDRRSDLYALGAVAYRCVTGYPAFAGPDSATILYDVVNKMPARPGSLATLPADLDAFFAIALAKRPGDRFADAREMSDAFARACRDELDAATRQRGSALSRTRWASPRGRVPTAR
jgi:tRNA A-37 threonylcarbamoyl transferase component Bud32